MLSTTPLQSRLLEQRSYVLRVWFNDDPANPWQALLERIADGDRHKFSNLDDLLAFLQDEIVPEQNERELA